MNTEAAMSARLNLTIRRRNRKLATILLIVALGMAAWGTLYLRHYGFNTDPHTERFH
jgi:hypothetical protein